jgi:hypothetical protein
MADAEDDRNAARKKLERFVADPARADEIEREWSRILRDALRLLLRDPGS